MRFSRLRLFELDGQFNQIAILSNNGIRRVGRVVAIPV